MQTRFFTGRGDEGESFFGSCRMSKSHPLFVCLGDLDELNSWLGWCVVLARSALTSETRRAQKTKKVSAVPVNLTETIKRMQELLFIAQAEVARSAGIRRTAEPPQRESLANGGRRAFIAGSEGKEIHIAQEHLRFLEDVIAKIDRVLPPLDQFVIPGGSELAAVLDVGRAIARRAERSLAAHPDRESFSLMLPAFLNRFSSALFALARYANHELHVDEAHPSYL